MCGRIGEVLRVSTGIQLLARRSGEFGTAEDILRSSVGGDRIGGAQQEVELLSWRAGGVGECSTLNER